MKLLIAIAFMFTVSADYNVLSLAPKTVMLEMPELQRGYLAQTGMEKCKKDEVKEQERANFICDYFGHLEAVENGYEVMATDGTEPLLKPSRRYNFRDIDPKKPYKCMIRDRKREFMHATKFVKINCLTL